MGSCWLRTNITGSATSASLPAAGVYGFTLTFADGVGGIVIANTISGTATMIVIYDPSAGFVTGGGWIMSPAGAYYADPSLAGKANFGFVSKYQKGATVPTGDTQFTFQTGNLDFHSTVYQWLVISGGLAQYKGSSTINGTGNLYLHTDRSRWGLVLNRHSRWFPNQDHGPSRDIVYDNICTTATTACTDNVTSGNTQALDGGSVIIHSGR